MAYLSSQPEQVLKGVGPKRAQQLAKLGAPNSLAGLQVERGSVDRLCCAEWLC